MAIELTGLLGHLTGHTDGWRVDANDNILSGPDGVVVPTQEAIEAHKPLYLAWVELENSRSSIKSQIAGLESTMSLRRIREAVRGPSGKAWLDNLDDKIAALRAQLTP